MSISKRLPRHLANMIAVEAAMVNLLENLSKSSAAFEASAAFLSDIAGKAAGQLKALKRRHQNLGHTETGTAFTFNGLTDISPEHPASSALAQASAAVNQAVVGYAQLRSIALRNRDSSLIGKENTGDLAEQHMETYVQALHVLNRILHNCVLWELDQEGEVCQCTCPSCGIGICMCAQGPRRSLSDIWAEAGPIADDTFVFVHNPRPGSVAEKAGLKLGDRVLRADDEQLSSHFVLQKVVSGHKKGEKIKLTVQRASNEESDITFVL